MTVKQLQQALFPLGLIEIFFTRLKINLRWHTRMSSYVSLSSLSLLEYKHF